MVILHCNVTNNRRKMKAFLTAGVFMILVSQTVNCDNILNGVPIPCGNNENCRNYGLAEGSVCVNGICMCPNDSRTKMINCTISHRVFPETRQIGALVGRTCKQPIECKLENGFCNTTVSQCLCKHGYVSNPDNNKCLPVVISIGGKCEDNKQCLATLHNAHCDNNQCVCLHGYHHAEHDCIKSIGFGETCTKTEECSHVDYAECNQQNVCACSSSTSLSTDGRRCLPHARQLNVECSESSQCKKTLDLAHCIHKRCQCLPNSHYNAEKSKCINTRGLGESCTEDHECYVGEWDRDSLTTACINDVCVCANNQTQVDDKCVSTGTATISKVSTVLIVMIIGVFVVRP